MNVVSEKSYVKETFLVISMVEDWIYLHEIFVDEFMSVFASKRSIV